MEQQLRARYEQSSSPVEKGQILAQLDKMSLGSSSSKMGASYDEEEPPIIVTGRRTTPHVPQSDAVFWATRAGGDTYGAYLLTQSLTMPGQLAPGVEVSLEVIVNGLRPPANNDTQVPTYVVNGVSPNNFSGVVTRDVTVTVGEREVIPDTDGDGVLDNVDADPNDKNVQTEIVVNGIRQDSANIAETLEERSYYALNGRFINAEMGPNGWIRIQTQFPTADQLKYKHNFDAAKSQLWYLDLPSPNFPSRGPGNSARIAAALTDAGIDAQVSRLNLVTLHTGFSSTIPRGQSRTLVDFTNWIITTQNLNINLRPTSSYNELYFFGDENIQVANTGNFDYNNL
jgi:hypothetical protein